MRLRTRTSIRIAVLSSLFVISLAAMADAFALRGFTPPSMSVRSEPREKNSEPRSVRRTPQRRTVSGRFPTLTIPTRVNVKVPTRPKRRLSKTSKPRSTVNSWVPILENVPILEIVPPLEDDTIVRAPRPRIVVLVHGMLTNAGSDADGELKTGHEYWGFEFVQGILGAEADQPLFSFAGLQQENQTDWISQAEGIVLSEGSEAHAFTALEPVNATPQPTGRLFSQTVEKPPMLSVMTTARDASVGLLRQTSQLTSQMERLLDWYRERFADYLDWQCRCEPELVLVSHSQGGHVARVWLSNVVVDPVDDELNPDRVEFSDGQRDTMNLIRDTTVFLATLGTPHDGTIFASRGWALFEDVDSSVTALGAVMGAIEAMLPDDVSIDTVPVRQAATDLLDVMPDSVRDLTQKYMFAINQDFLHPTHARRSPNANELLGNGTGDTYIPVYTFGGRSPGSVHLVDYDLVAGFEGVFSESEGAQVNILIKLGIDGWMASYPTGWGNLDGDHAGHGQVLDRVARANLKDVEDLATDYAEGSIPFPVQLEIAAGPGDLVGWLTERLFGREYLGDLPAYLRQNFRVEDADMGALTEPVIWCGNGEFPLGGNELELPPLAYFFLEVIQGGPDGLWDYLEGSVRLTEVIALSLTDNVEQIRDAITAGTLAQEVSVLIQGITLEVTLQELASSLSLSLFNDLVAQGCANPSTWDVGLRTVEDFPLPSLVAIGGSVSDNEIDSDGAVNYDSAMGFYIGYDDPWSFEHTDGGAWYRRTDSPFEEEFHEGMTIRYHLGAYLYHELVSQAGPIATSADVSVAP